MNKIVIITSVILFCLFQRDGYSIDNTGDSIYITNPEKVEKDVFNDYYFGSGYYFSVSPNPFSPSSVYQLNFYLPYKMIVNFSLLDTSNILVFRISSLEIEKGFYKAYLNIVKLKTGNYYMEMETVRYRCRLLFSQIS